MKKLMTILVVFALCGTAMAVTGTSSAKEQYPLFDGANQNYVNFKPNAEEGSSGLKYTVYGSGWSSNSGNRMGHVYFTTMSQEDLKEYNRINKTNVQKVAVQFVGAQWDKSGVNTAWDKEYGIYLLEDVNDPTKYMSVSKNKNYFELEPGQSFGVYYKKDGKYVTSTIGYIGNYDTGREIHDQNYGKNKITVYKENENGQILPEEDWTYKKFMCLFPNDYANPKHWEFMLQTRLDDPKVDVRPDDVNEVLPPATTSGQPLPGTLATLLIGGLCAKTLSKKNKKH